MQSELQSVKKLCKYPRSIHFTVETALNAELTEHLGYQQHTERKHSGGNMHNGRTPKCFKGKVLLGFFTSIQIDGYTKQTHVKHQVLF